MEEQEQIQEQIVRDQIKRRLIVGDIQAVERLLMEHRDMFSMTEQLRIQEAIEKAKRGNLQDVQVLLTKLD